MLYRMTFSSDLIQIRSVFQREMPVNQQLIWISDLNLLNSRTKDCSVSICRCKSWTVIIWLASCLEVLSLKFWHITTFFPTIIIVQLSNNTWGGGRISVPDDTAVTVGAEVEVQAEQVSAVNATKETKEISVDPISFSCYCMILTWAIEQRNIFVLRPFCDSSRFNQVRQTRWEDTQKNCLL